MPEINIIWRTETEQPDNTELNGTTRNDSECDGIDKGCCESEMRGKRNQAFGFQISKNMRMFLLQTRLV